MSYEQCTYSPESVADCWPTSFSDTGQLSLLSWNHTPAKSCANEPPKDGSQICTCGKEMSDCSIHPSTPEKWIASMRDSLAKTLALLESRQAYLREPDQGFTEKSCVLLASLDRDICSWRTLQQSFLTDSEPFSQTWPRWGMTQGGYAYAHPMSERRITEIDGGYLPTPSGTSNHGKNHVSGRLDEWGGSSNPWRGTEIGKIHCASFEEWMLGLPIKWTELTELETRKSRSKPQPHGDCSEVAK